MRARMENLKLATRELNKSVKPQLLNLERELRDLNHKILNGSKKMEGLEEKIYQT